MNFDFSIYSCTYMFIPVMLYLIYIYIPVYILIYIFFDLCFGYRLRKQIEKDHNLSKNSLKKRKNELKELAQNYLSRGKNKKVRSKKKKNDSIHC